MQFNNEVEKRVEKERVKFEKREENIKNEFKTQAPIKLEKIPHIGSTYRSNIYNINIDMAISDEYEGMPEYF